MKTIVHRASYALALALVFSSGCATFRHSKPQPETPPPALTVNTVPNGTEVYSGIQHMGTTPLQLPLPYQGTLTFFKQGFAPLQWQTTMSGAGQNTITLEPQSVRLHALFSSAKARFVIREGLGLTIEPYNRPVKIGSSFLLQDPVSGQTLRYTVATIYPRYLDLTVNEDTISQPIVYIPQDMPPVAKPVAKSTAIADKKAMSAAPAQPAPAVTAR